jgi:hypothetical protein
MPMKPGLYRCTLCKQYNFPETLSTRGKNRRVMKLSEAAAATTDGGETRVHRYPVGMFTQLFGRDGDYRGLAETSVNLGAGPPGAGKMLCLRTPLPTPDGWTTMGAVKQGDTLFDERGKPCKVLHAHRVELHGDTYEMEFSDGEKIVACGDHLWRTMTKSERYAALKRTPEARQARRAKRNPKSTRYHTEFISSFATSVSTTGSVRSTREIAASMYKGAHLNHSIDRAAPLVLPDAELPVAPYTLGVWLGDGTTGVGEYTGIDIGIADSIRIEGYKVVRRNYGTKASKWCVRGLSRGLRRIGVFYEKHIPNIYLRASIRQRVELLRGLMDTDGECDSQGRCGFSTSSCALRDGFSELLASLGIKANYVERESWLYSKQYGPHWRFTFTTALRAFHLRRKADRQRPPRRGGLQRRRFIAAIRPVPSVPMRCITVDSPSKLYLAGRGMVPTHNTTAFLQIAELVMDQIPAGDPRGDSVAWIANEMSPLEVDGFARRLGVRHRDRIDVVNAMGGLDFDLIPTLKGLKPRLILLDSLSSLIGDVGDADSYGETIVKQFKRYAVEYRCPVLMVNQVNKQGNASGLNKTLHAGDALFYFDFDGTTGIREMYSEKNRFGQAPVELHMVMMEDTSETPGRLVPDVDWYRKHDQPVPDEHNSAIVIVRGKEKGGKPSSELKKTIDAELSAAQDVQESSSEEQESSSEEDEIEEAERLFKEIEEREERLEVLEKRARAREKKAAIARKAKKAAAKLAGGLGEKRAGRRAAPPKAGGKGTEITEPARLLADAKPEPVEKKPRRGVKKKPARLIL